MDITSVCQVKIMKALDNIKEEILKNNPEDIEKFNEIIKSFINDEEEEEEEPPTYNAEK